MECYKRGRDGRGRVFVWEFYLFSGEEEAEVGGERLEASVSK